jgi:hypothetical protein
LDILSNAFSLNTALSLADNFRIVSTLVKSTPGSGAEVEIGLGFSGEDDVEEGIS